MSNINILEEFLGEIGLDVGPIMGAVTSAFPLNRFRAAPDNLASSLPCEDYRYPACSEHQVLQWMVNDQY